MGLLGVSSVLITLAEPQGTALTHMDQALWWSIVTSTTVGYGDLYPVSTAGKVIAVILPMFMGIGLGAAFITHVASYLIERRDQKMHGEKPYTGNGHILLVGHTDETEYLAQQIREDETYSHQDIVLLADLPRHPMPEQKNLYFVKGRPDTITALNRANTGQADQIIIHTGNDEVSLFALINGLKLKKSDCDITVRCLSSQSLETFTSVPGHFETIMQMTAEMMVQAMQDKVHIPLQILLKNDANEEIYYVSVPEIKKGQTWWDLHHFLKQKYEYLSFALQRPDKSILVNPMAKEPVTPGCGIWLIAPKRPVNMEWPG
ncbi:MAG: NAD-binding protein [Desulfobacter sp.]|nr:MAG: NAD-binding protein [Desulfobacter sp.]